MRAIMASSIVFAIIVAALPESAQAQVPSAVTSMTMGASTKSGRGSKKKKKDNSSVQDTVTTAPERTEKASAPTAPAGAPKEEITTGPRGPTRIDFDDRLIQGQTNKSGAVYLFDRKELAIRSMVRQRTGFRDQIVRDVLTE